MQCTGIITLACLIFELVPFVVFHTWILSGACPSFTTWGKTGVSCDNLPLLLTDYRHQRFPKFSDGMKIVSLSFRTQKKIFFSVRILRGITVHAFSICGPARIQWMEVIRFNYFPLIICIKNLILQKLNIPGADYGSIQYFVEKVKYKILEKQTNATPWRKCFFFR